MTRPDNQLAPLKPKTEANQPEQEPLYTLLRLLVGGAVIGADELLRRSKQWQEEINQVVVPKMVIAPISELERNHLRHTLLGLLFQTPEVVETGLSKAGQVSGAAAGLVGRVFSPLVNSRLVRPVKRRYDKLAAQGEAKVEQWANRGRAEEQVSRALAEQAITQLFDELLDEVIIQLAQKPEVRDLLQQQSVSMAGEVMGEVRQRTAGADAILERLARAMLRRTPREAIVELPTPATAPNGQVDKT